MRPLKVLHAVEFYDPSKGGAQEVVKQISEKLVKRGHVVTVVTSKLPHRTSNMLNGVKIVEFDIKGNYVTGMRGPVSQYQNFVKKGNFDLVMNYAAQQWSFDALIPVLPNLEAKMIFAPCGFSGLKLKKFRNYYRTMPKWLTYYNRLIFHSSKYHDIIETQKWGFRNLEIIPNGASEEEFNLPLEIIEKFKINNRLDDKFILLSVGSHTGLKGHQFLMKVFSKLSVENAILLIIGNKPYGRGCYRKCKMFSYFLNQYFKFKKMKRKIVMADYVRADTIKAFYSSDLFLFASNIECSPIVLFESMAAGLPFVSFDVGNAAEIVDWSGGGVVIPTQKHKKGFCTASVSSMVAVVEQLVVKKNERERLGELGRRSWENNFTWEKITDKWEHMYYAVVREESDL